MSFWIRKYLVARQDWRERETMRNDETRLNSSSLIGFFFCLFVFFFFLAGVYGDVHRVKILFNKKDTALIQMAEPHQAQLGKQQSGVIWRHVTKLSEFIFIYLYFHSFQQWLTWTSWNSMVSSWGLCHLSTRASRCPKKVNLMLVWPRTLSTRLFIVSRNPAAKIIKISTPLHPRSTCRIFRTFSRYLWLQLP